MPEMQDSTKVTSICGVANLLAAVLEKDPDYVKAKLGLPIRKRYKERRCRNCGELLMEKGKSLCPSCRLIPVVCDWCGKVFQRYGYDLVYRFGKRGQKHVFCSRKCMGSWTAVHYGFIVHPENRGRKRRWDYNLVWQKHLETGYGCVRLSRLLGIPYGTVYYILRYMDMEMATTEIWESGRDEVWPV